MARDNGDNDEPRIWALRDRGVVSPQASLARGMRRAPTDAEKRLWWHLRRLSWSGSHFRRQVRLGRYIVDFASHKARLVIEVDGGQHAENAADAVRTKFIEAKGYRVLRFWNNDVLGNVEGVLEVIQSAITSLPTPPLQGQGDHIQQGASAPSQSKSAAADFDHSANGPKPAYTQFRLGEGRGGRSGGFGTGVPHSPTPTPDPSPQGGGEKNRRQT
jgi:very-short-patch-repair endonuclease